MANSLDVNLWLLLINFTSDRCTCNKILFKRTWYVSAQLTINSNPQCLHHLSCSFKCYSIHCICQTTSSGFYGRLVQWEQKGEVGWYIHPKGENSMAVCGFGCENSSVVSLHKWSWIIVISPHRTSMQCSSAICVAHCLRNLITNVLRMTECNCTCSLEQENPYV